MKQEQVSTFDPEQYQKELGRGQFFDELKYLRDMQQITISWGAVKFRLDSLKKMNAPMYWKVLYKHLGSDMQEAYCKEFAKNNFMDWDNDQELRNELRRRFAILSDVHYKCRDCKPYLKVNKNGSFELDQEKAEAHKSGRIKPYSASLKLLNNLMKK